MPLIRVSSANATARLDIPCLPGEKLSVALWLSGQLAPVPLCAGLGRCGNCRCRFLQDPPTPSSADLAFFSEKEQANGWRLACRHSAPDSPVIELELPENSFFPILHPAASKINPARQNQKIYLGIDLGTTSIYWRALLNNRETLSQGSLLNPQAAAGADIISRLRFASTPAGLSQLSRRAGEAIGEIVREIGGDNVERMCIAGNSAMSAIFLEKDITGLCAAPYKLAFHGNETVSLNLPGIEKTLPAYFPPQPAPFIGGDISAGLVTLLHAKKPFIMADLGTNAEMALIDANDQAFLLSAPLGPAMEGVGPVCGHPAAPGVITRFTLAPSGLQPCFYDSTCANGCKGISATGYLSLLAILFRMDCVAADGQFHTSEAPLAQRIMRLNERVLELPHNLSLTLADMELMLKIKAIFRVALQSLLEAARLSAAQLNAFYLAGALGEYVNMDDLTTLGFISRALASKTRVLGNASLNGACELALDPDLAQHLVKLYQHKHIIQLADDSEFLNKYMQAMSWGE